MIDIVVYGAGGHAMILLDLLERTKSFRIMGLIGADSELKESMMGYPVFKGEEHLDRFLNQGVINVALGIGGLTDNGKRRSVYHKLKSMGFNLPNIIDSSAIVSQYVTFGDAVVVFPGVIINAEVSIGNNVIIATGSSVDHESVIKDHVLVSAGVTIGAGNLIHESALIGLGSKLVSHVAVGKGVLVGAGAVVVKDILEAGTYVGLPARKMSDQ